MIRIAVFIFLIASIIAYFGFSQVAYAVSNLSLLVFGLFLVVAMLAVVYYILVQ